LIYRIEGVLYLNELSAGHELVYSVGKAGCRMGYLGEKVVNENEYLSAMMESNDEFDARYSEDRRIELRIMSISLWC
jgi:hypothetical protein